MHPVNCRWGLCRRRSRLEMLLHITSGTFMTAIITPKHLPSVLHIAPHPPTRLSRNSKKALHFCLFSSAPLTAIPGTAYGRGWRCSSKNADLFILVPDKSFLSNPKKINLINRTQLGCRRIIPALRSSQYETYGISQSGL